MKTSAKIYAAGLIAATEGLSRNQGEGVLQRFILRLTEDRRQNLLPQIILEVAQSLRKSEIFKAVYLRSPFPVDENTKEKLKKQFNRDTVIEERAPELLGGIWIRVGDTVYDGSLRRALDTIQSAK